MKKTLLDYNLKVRLPITVLVILITFGITFYVSRPERDSVGYAPEQPIKYSHKLHAGKLKLDCKYCHTGVEKSRHAMVPPASTCMNCHSVARADKPEIIKLKKYYDDGKSIPWKRVHKVPDYAYFNHSSHVVKGIDCKYCHGDVANLEVMTQVHSFTMGSCLNCHREPKKEMPELKDVKNGPTYCTACHR